jgi:hypothetical protein
VVLAGDAIDAPATERLRTEMRAARKAAPPMIDRGPGFEIMRRGEAPSRMR